MKYLHLQHDIFCQFLSKCLGTEKVFPFFIQVLMNSMENKKVFVCPVEGCSKMFRRLSKYKTHQMRHTGERPFKVRNIDDLEDFLIELS